MEFTLKSSRSRSLLRGCFFQVNEPPAWGVVPFCLGFVLFLSPLISLNCLNARAQYHRLASGLGKESTSVVGVFQ